jgi:hypothetical protein
LPLRLSPDKGQFPERRGGVETALPGRENAGRCWRRPVAWTVAMGQFAILFGARYGHNDVLTHMIGHDRAAMF